MVFKSHTLHHQASNTSEYAVELCHYVLRDNKENEIQQIVHFNQPKVNLLSGHLTSAKRNRYHKMICLTLLFMYIGISKVLNLVLCSLMS